MRIVILGAGYGGLALARALAGWFRRQAEHSVLLIDQNADHQLLVRLHEVASGSIPPEDALVPYARVLESSGVEFQQARVTRLEPTARQVQTSTGTVRFDLLVVALGGETEYFGLPGLREHAFPLRTHQHAVRLRRHVEHQVVRAARETDPARRQAHLTFVIGGGGYTGTELAGELADRLRELRALHQVSSPARILLLEAREHLLSGFPPAAIQRATASLCARGVEVCPEMPVAGAAPGQVLLATGEAIAAGTVVWAGGVRAHPLVAESGLPTGNGGRARLDRTLRWEGHEHLFVLGDCSEVTDPESGEPVLPSAQLAIQQATHTAHNLYRAVTGRPLLPFTRRPWAEAVSLGRNDAVALAGGLLVTGTSAHLLKGLSYRRYRLSLGA